MSLQSTDPEYTQRLGAFLEEVKNEPGSMLEPTTRWLAILATLTGSGSIDAYKEVLPQALQEGLDPDDRLEKGIAAQAEIFGDHMNETWKAGTVNRYLAANCFGDYYTRTGLNLAQREMITFCFLSAQGGCEPQLTAHAKGNINMGNDAAFLTKVVLQCLPYIGYPRSLNAMGCIAKAAKQ